MWIENNVFLEDLEFITQADYIPWEKLRNKTIFITGGTGLIGSTLINSLLYANKKKALDLQILALVRSEEKARYLFAQQLQENLPLKFIIGNVENLPSIAHSVDYIVHGASPTAGYVNNFV